VNFQALATEPAVPSAPWSEQPDNYLLTMKTASILTLAPEASSECV
jgi:hypothetical protein